MLLKYFLAWFAMIILAVLNGGFRDSIYKNQVGELAAHQISTIILIILIFLYLRYLTRAWPIKSTKEAWIIGLMWFIMTVAFEFAMGRLLLNESWNNLLYAYNLIDGQLWVLIPIWVLIGPYVFYRYIQK